MKKKTTRNKPKRPTTAKQIFAILREFLTRTFLDAYTKQARALYDEQVKVWAVMGAVRGPDANSGDSLGLKHATTAIVRHALLGTSDEYGALHPDAREFQKRRKALPDPEESQHFRTHAKRAFEALGLDWEKNNSRKRKGRKA